MNRLNIGIVTAMYEEMEPYLNSFVITSKQKMFGRDVFVSKGDVSYNYYFIVSGIGKVRSASAAQLLLSMGVDIIINVGTCCSLNIQYDVGDILLLDSSVQVDSYYDRVMRSRSDKYYSDFIFLSLKSQTDRVYRVSGGTGDTFLHDNDHKLKLAKDFEIDCYDMETAAISDISEVSDIPFVAVRIVSDGISGDSHRDFLENLKFVSEKLASHMSQIIKVLREN